MKRYILGAIIGVGLVTAGYAVAATKGTTGLSVVDRLGDLKKIYDSDANVVCYLYTNGTVSAATISCLKNI